jgi:hypothetical protein
MQSPALGAPLLLLLLLLLHESVTGGVLKAGL